MLSVKDHTVLYVAIVYILLISNFPIRRKSSVKLRFWRLLSILFKKSNGYG
jgi:hypothetical protein